MWSVLRRLRRALDCCSNVGGAAVDGAGTSPRVRDQSELGGNDDVVAAADDRLRDDFFAVEGAVDLGGVDVGDTEVEGAVDGADRLTVVEAAFGRVGAGHGHGAEADAGDGEITEVGVLHEGLLSDGVQES